jgi:glycosyltransferase involved in cell wall biosynthesis
MTRLEPCLREDSSGTLEPTPSLRLTVDASIEGMHATPAVEIVIPVHNEERDLPASVRKLHSCMSRRFTFPFRLTIADNASSDETPARALALAHELEEVEVLRLEQKGRGRALRAAWGRSEAEVVAYMDVDLSTDLAALPGLLLPLLESRADIAIGSRLAPGAEVSRPIKREFISRSYNLLLHLSLGTGFADAQCGFKAARREVILPLLDQVQDEGWFFDTELLYLAQRSKLAIREVPVRWVDDPDSRVDIIATACEDLRGIRRLRRGARDARALPARAREGSMRVPVSSRLPAQPSRRSA